MVSFTASIVVAACLLFAGMLLAFEVGRRLGVVRLARDPGGITAGSGPVEAAVFGLLGLLLAFTFSGAGSRFEERRHLITEESNAIGTAYLRIDLLPPDTQPQMRQTFRRYLDTRIDTYRNTADSATVETRRAEASALQDQIWAAAVSGSRGVEAHPQAAMLLLPALNAMFDITTTRVTASQNHPPRIIFALLAGLSLVSAVLMGYVMCGARDRSWFYLLLVAATMSCTLYVILDLEYPRLGLVRVDATDQILVELRNHMQ
jgi:hypothetical protein